MDNIQYSELVYIGKRPFKIDNVCNTGTTWFGYGDVQKVDRRFEPKFLLHPDVWVTLDKFKKASGVHGGVGASPVDSIVPPAVIAPQSEASTGEQEPADSESEQQESETDSASSSLDSIKAAILGLEQGNPAHFSSTNGVPIVSAVRNAAGDESISVAQVRAAWAELNK